MRSHRWRRMSARLFKRIKMLAIYKRFMLWIALISSLHTHIVSILLTFIALYQCPLANLLGCVDRRHCQVFVGWWRVRLGYPYLRFFPCWELALFLHERHCQVALCHTATGTCSLLLPIGVIVAPLWFTIPCFAIPDWFFIGQSVPLMVTLYLRINI